MSATTDTQYFQSLPDYEEFAPYLEGGSEDVALPEFVPDFSSILVVDGVPKVGPEKMAKLKGVILKIYQKIYSSLAEDHIDMPVDGDMSLGFCFIKFQDHAQAEKAMEVTQGFAIDKKHKFNVSLYSDLQKYANMPDEYVDPSYPAFKARPDPTSWLTDLQCRDQFVIRHGQDTEIYWANTNAGDKPAVVYGGENQKDDANGTVWCESYVQWSPSGTYLATFHPRGVKLWGSTGFSDQGKYGHNGVQELQFSPCEKHMITYAFPNPEDPHANLNETMIVWDILSQTKLRSFEWRNPLLQHFQVEAKTYQLTEKMQKDGKEPEQIIVRGRIRSYDPDTYCFDIEEGSKVHSNVRHDQVHSLQDPNRLKWSPDGKYVARLDIHQSSGTDIISIYELPEMKLLDKKSVPAAGCLDFSWSPKRNMFAYWAPASDNLPAGIKIVGVPDRSDICSRKLYQVHDGRMVWQDQGDYLCVYMTKMVGKKRSMVLMFFRVKESDCPVEQLEIAETVQSVSWEPSGDRIAIVTGDARTFTHSFYSMNGVAKDVNATGLSDNARAAIPGMAPVAVKKQAPKKEKKELTLLFALPSVQATDVIWSPAGGVAALAFYASDTCMFELHDVDNNQNLASRRHDRGNRLVWDPSGRIIVSCTITDIKNAKMRGHPSDGYVMYTFQGQVLNQVSCEKMFQFSWRPRPKDLLTADEKKKITKNLKKYEKEFDKEDRAKKQELNAENLNRRRALADDFLARLKYNQNLNLGLKAQRVAARDGYDSDDDANYTFSTLLEETVVKTIETVMAQ